MIPITRSFPPTNSPNTLTTLPGSPVPKISLVEDTLSEILNMVVKSRMVGKACISSGSFENSAINKITSATAILNARSTSSNALGTDIIRKTMAARIYNPTNKSDFFMISTFHQLRTF